ncbi:MAG TPA: 3D domain-containing protein [Phycisphaerae bacterium]|nr:3D domain-containing protein [Phycisphaerae bacterium]
MNRAVGERERRTVDRGGWEALRALGLNLKHWADDYPVAVSIVASALAIVLLVVVMVLARGCEAPARAGGFNAEGAEKNLGLEKAAMGGRQASMPAEPSGCGVWLGVCAGPLVRPGGSKAEVGCPPVQSKAGSAGICLEEGSGRGAGNAPAGLGGPHSSAKTITGPLTRRDHPAGENPAGRCLSIRRFRVTAYDASEKCCGQWADGRTASGTRADHPLVAAPRDFPFGTRLRIPGYAVGWEVRVEDRGGAIKGDRLDVLFDDYESAVQWGVQWLEVERLGP